MSDLYSISPLQQGHRLAAEAKTAETNSSWTSAMYKHKEASKYFTKCLGLTSHPSANQCLHLLIKYHLNRSERIKQMINSNKIIEQMIVKQGYIHPSSVNPLSIMSSFDHEIYQTLRLQIQSIISYTHHMLTNKEQEISELHSQLSSIEESTDNSGKCVDQKSSDIEIDGRAIHINNEYYGENDINDEPLQIKPKINENSENVSENKIQNENKILKKNITILNKIIDKQLQTLTEYRCEIYNKYEEWKQMLDSAHTSISAQMSNENVSNSVLKNKNMQQKRFLNRSMSSATVMKQDRNYEYLQDKIKELEEENDRRKRTFQKSILDWKQKAKGWYDYAKKMEKNKEIYKHQLKVLVHDRKQKKKISSTNTNFGCTMSDILEEDES